MDVRRLGPLAESWVHVRHHLVMVQLLLAILTIYLMLLLTIHMLLVVLWMWLPATHPNETRVVRDLLIELVGLLLELHTKPVLFSFRQVVLRRSKSRLLRNGGGGIDVARVPIRGCIDLAL